MLEPHLSSEPLLLSVQRLLLGLRHHAQGLLLSQEHHPLQEHHLSSVRHPPQVHLRDLVQHLG